MERCDDAAERKLRCAPVNGRAGQFREASVAAVTPMESHLLAGRYRLLQPLGQGGMGMVWRARDELLGRDVAVKEVLVPAELPAGERAIVRERTLREARSAARLSHPNVVTIFDVVEESGRPWVVMEFVSSRPLADVVREDGPLPPRQVAEIGRQLLAALRVAHAAGVLHRDVKPGNVLLGTDGRVVLTDFGIALLEGDPALTASGMLVGSPAFMAPERVQGKGAGPESDLWSLGATLYTAVEGRAPHDRGAPLPTVAAVVTEAADPPRLAGPLWPVIEGLLRKNPAERLSAEEAEHLLRGVASAVGQEEQAPPERQRPAGLSPTVTDHGAGDGVHGRDGQAGRDGWRTSPLLAPLPGRCGPRAGTPPCDRRGRGRCRAAGGIRAWLGHAELERGSRRSRRAACCEHDAIRAAVCAWADTEYLAVESADDQTVRADVPTAVEASLRTVDQADRDPACRLHPLPRPDRLLPRRARRLERHPAERSCLLPGTGRIPATHHRPN